MARYDTNKTAGRPYTKSEPGAERPDAGLITSFVTRAGFVSRNVIRPLSAAGSVFVRLRDEWQYCTLPN